MSRFVSGLLLQKIETWFKWWFRGSKPLTLCAKCRYICIFCPRLQFLSDSQRQTRLSWSQAATSQPEDPTVVAPCPRFSPALRHMKLNYLEPSRNMRLSFLTDSSASEPPKCHSFLISREANCPKIYNVSQQLSPRITKYYPSTLWRRHFRHPVI